MAKGILTLEEYKEEVETFMAKSDLLHEGWIKFQSDSSPDSIHIVKKIVKSININPKQQEQASLLQTRHKSLDEELELIEDKHTLKSHGEPSKAMLTLEYHIVYSTTYQVPVLYFNAYKPNGRLLSLEELWASIPSHYQGVDKWSFITQQEHPLLGRPFFQMHPCYTETFMAKLGKSMEKRYYLIRWLSAFGPAIHLNVSLGFANA